jgi:cyclohexanone monooxygenase
LKDSVLLIDADTDGPFEEITEKGIRAGGKEYEFDIIVFATGFDAFTGSLKALNIKGCGGRALNDAWADGPRTYLGSRSPDFPTCSRSPARKARRCWRTCRWRSSRTDRPGARGRG